MDLKKAGLKMNKGYMTTVSVLILIAAVCTSCGNESNEIGRGAFDFEASGIEMVNIDGGTFEMGDVWGYENAYDDEYPVHIVTLSDYYLSATEVTNAQYCAFLNEVGNREERGEQWVNLEGDERGECLIEEIDGRFYPKSGFDDHPVIYVNWYGALAFCEWLSEKTGDEYRLPTEAEWEYAARSGGSDDQKWSGTDNKDQLSDYAWYYSNSGIETHIVGTKIPNALGFYDLSGNVCEWCSDWHSSDYYRNSPTNNPTGPSSGDLRVTRGASWQSASGALRSSSRDRFSPGSCRYDLGFRLCRIMN